MLQKKGNKGFYYFTLVILWLSSIFSFVTFWVVARNGFVVNNGSLLSILLHSNAPSPVLSVFILMPIFVADTILVSLTKSAQVNV